MIKIEEQEQFDLNVLKVLFKSLNAGIETGPNILGASGIPFCKRTNIIGALFGIQINSNNKMLFGQIYEFVLHQPRILKALIYKLHSTYKFDGKITVLDTKKSDMWEISEGHFIRLHPDIYTNLYSIEVKTTGMYVRDWVKELAPYQFAQLNTYLGYYKQPVGFLHKLNIRAFLATIKYTEFYWDILWDKYGYFLEATFDKEVFELTIERAHDTFECIDNKRWKDIPGPEMPWECKSCDPEIKKICGHPISRQKLDVDQDCDNPACKKRIPKGEIAVFRNEFVYCNDCLLYVRDQIE